MILLAAGGTGGHIFPAIATAQESLNESVIITDARFKKYGTRNITLKIEYLPIHSSSNKFKFFLSLIPSAIKSIRLILKYKPEKILSFGGYPTIPVLVAGVLLRKKIILHEANAVLGKTNKFFYPFASLLCAGFPLVGFKKKYKISKNPVTKDVLFSSYPPIKDTLNILVIGGSQAAKVFSERLPDIFVKFAAGKKLRIVQQCKLDEIDGLKDFYSKHGIECEVSNFFHDIIDKIKNAHIVISRAGALSITEIITIGRPSILVPYPYASDDHQFFNAKFVEENGMGILIEQKDLEENTVISTINKILQNLDGYLTNLTEHSREIAL